MVTKMIDSYINIIFPNVYEYMHRGMDDNFDKRLLCEWRDIAAGYSEVSMFWEGDNKLIVSPKPIDKVFVDFAKYFMGYKELSILFPRNYNSQLQYDFSTDRQIVSKVACYLKNKETINFIPWGATEGAYRFFNCLKKKSIKIVSHELPSESEYWTSLYFDSKIGFREQCKELQKEHPQIKIPCGYTCGSIKEAISIIRHFHTSGKQCVLKANGGAGGFGNVFITNKFQGKTFGEVEEYIYHNIKELPYFKTGASLVEELIKTPSVKSCKSANPHSCFMSGFIDQYGGTKIIAGGSDIRNVYNCYSGAILGKDVFSVNLLERLKSVMEIVGQSISSKGYRGHWGINFMVKKDGYPIIIELNPRRCGESHVHNLCKHLFGENWMETTFAISHLPLDIRLKASPNDEMILSLFERINQGNSKENVYAIPTQLSWLRKKRFPGIGYTVIGSSKKRVQLIDKLILRELTKLGIIPL